MSVVGRLVSVIMTVVSVSAAYLYILNRLLIQMRGKRLKSFMIRSGGLLTLAGSALLGWRIGRSRWMLASAAGFSLTVLNEVRHVTMRSKRRGAPPVAEIGPAIDLRRPATTMDLILRHYEVPVAGWSGPPLRVAQVSDLHLNSHLPIAYFEDAMRKVTAAKPDLVFFTGDFITEAAYVPLIGRVLPLAQARLGSFGVLGNHDRWADPEGVRAVVASAGVRMLRDGAVRLSLGEDHAVTLSGFEHPWGDQQWEAPERLGDELQIILTHTPDNVYQLKDRGFDAIFAGHYHGGQIRMPGLGSLVVPSRYGRRYDRGHFVFGRTHLFVSSGVGSAEPPVRIWCPPDVLIVDFLPGGAA